MCSTDDQPARAEQPGWETIVSGTGPDAYELLQFLIKVEGFAAAARVGVELASLIAEHDDPYINVSLRPWRVEIGISVPKERWTTAAQRDLATAITRRYSQ